MTTNQTTGAVEPFTDENGTLCVRVPVHVSDVLRDRIIKRQRRITEKVADGIVKRTAYGNKSPVPADQTATLERADWENLRRLYGDCRLVAQGGVAGSVGDRMGGVYVVLHDRRTHGSRIVARLILGLGKSRRGKRKVVRYWNRNRFDLRRCNLKIEVQIVKRYKRAKLKVAQTVKAHYRALWRQRVRRSQERRQKEAAIKRRATLRLNRMLKRDPEWAEQNLLHKAQSAERPRRGAVAQLRWLEEHEERALSETANAASIDGNLSG